MTGEARPYIVIPEGQKKLFLRTTSDLGLWSQSRTCHNSMVQNVTFPFNQKSDTLNISPDLSGCLLISVLVERTAQMRQESHWNFLSPNSIDLIIRTSICYLHWCLNSSHLAIIWKIVTDTQLKIVVT